MAEIKTKQNTASVEDFISKVPDEQKRKDSYAIIEMMKDASGEEPKMWGTSLVGFGKKKFKSPATGREVDWFIIGFSPRKANLSLHLVFDIKKHQDVLAKLGKYKTGAGCLYINKLSDVNVVVLKNLILEAAKNNF